MLNRRQALAAGTVLAATARRLQAQPTLTTDRPEVFPDCQAAAQIVSECAAACQQMTATFTEELADGESVRIPFLKSFRECGEICSVTATLIAQPGPTAPAICQACADTCQRLLLSVRELREFCTTKSLFDSEVLLRCIQTCQKLAARTLPGNL